MTMITDDYENIIQWYPELVLVSKQPTTWQGFLPISSNSRSKRIIRIKLKLILPKYPSLDDVEITFGKAITLLRSNEGFGQKVQELTRNVTKLSSFLRKLQSLITSIIKNTYVIQDNEYEGMDSTTGDILQELKDVLAIPSDIQILSDSTLNTIKLSLRNVTVKLQRAKFGPHPWTVVHCDLPEIPALGPFEKNLDTLTIARNKLKKQIEIFEKAWLKLKQIDENCWVVDPVPPKPCHLYRRIYLTPSLSMYIQIDPWYPTDLPEIKFMGSETEVELKRGLVSKNLYNWNPKSDIIDNLTVLLNIYAFPRKIENEYIEDDDAIVADKECCICFCLELNSVTLPDKICDNGKCRKHFHTSCLLQWLQAVAGNHVVFNHIHGSCPNCQESISCRIK